MNYTPAAQAVIGALRSVREPDEGVWWDRAILAIGELYPTSAIAWALYQADVWRRERRIELRAGVRPASTVGVNFEDLIDAFDAAAVADGAPTVDEVHLARGLRAFDRPLLELGIAVDALIARTEERRQMPPRSGVPRKPRIVGAARASLLEEKLAEGPIDWVLKADERGAHVERKRSILNTERDALADHEQAAIALVNGSVEVPVYLIFGQEDDGTVLGQVDHRREPLDPETVRKCQRRLDQRLQACVPAVPVQWVSLKREGMVVWVACLLGRAERTAVRTSIGAYPYRSGEDTHFADPTLITAWQRGAAPTDLATTNSEPSTEHEGLSPVPVGGSAARRVLAALRTAVTELYRKPPTIPTSVANGSVEAWAPVVEPLLEHFRPAVEAVVGAALDANNDELLRLMRGVRSVFGLSEAASGTTWILEAPRLVTRLIADRVMVAAYSTDRWERIWQTGQALFDSAIGRVPWVVSPEYLYPETVGNNVRVANDLVLRDVLEHAQQLSSYGVDEAGVQSAYAALSVALGLAMTARDPHSPRALAQTTMGLRRPEVWSEFERWEEEPALVGVVARLAGEDVATFLIRLRDRITAAVQTQQQIGWMTRVPERGWATVERLTNDGHALSSVETPAQPQTE